MFRRCSDSGRGVSLALRNGTTRSASAVSNPFHLSMAPRQRNSDRLGMIGFARVNQIDFHQGWPGVAGFGTQTGTRNYSGLHN